MASKPVTEYRYVCANFGTARHGSHFWLKKTRAKAEKSAADTNEHAAGLKNHWTIREIPYRTQERTVTKWKDTE